MSATPNSAATGSDIDTPTLNSLAAGGLRYANLHVTPLCSPTRTCPLAGRNRHSVGKGRVGEMANGSVGNPALKGCQSSGRNMLEEHNVEGSPQAVLHFAETP